MLAVSSVMIDGVVIPLDEVAADVVIRHGRAGYADSTTASTAQVTLLNPTRTFVRSIVLSRPLVINYRVDGGPEKPRFTGRTTDALVEQDRVTIIAVGRLSTLGGYTVGKTSYPESGWLARVNGLFIEAGLDSYLVWADKAGLSPTLTARAADPIPLAQYLDQLLAMNMAFASDLPDGRILVEPGESRNQAEQTPIVVPSSSVLFAPTWSKVLPGFNDVSTGYGPSGSQGTARYTDPDAIADYGPRPVSVDPSELRNQDDAELLCQLIVMRQARPRWSTPAATLLEGVELKVGKALKISGVPPPAPYGVWTAIVEGWTDQISSDGERVTWTTEVALSDPNLSGSYPHTVWEDLPASDVWSSIDPAVTWADADALAP